ncbi:MAG TPA: alpha/beta hydrolase [Ktedonobacterales bacterium]
MATNLLAALLMRGRNQRNLARQLVITAPSGVLEQRFATIGEIEQWITISGEDRANPVLLFVHGGPGSVYSVLSPPLRPWERFFTIVQWDQRGAGKTLGRNGKAGCGAITFDRLVQDGLELTEYLRGYLGQEKIILVGSSVGSLTGMMMAKRRPDLFWAYVGTDQNTGVASLQRSYELTLAMLRAARNTRGVQAVEMIGARLDRLTPKEARTLHQWTIRADPSVPDMIDDIFLPGMLSSPDHTLHDVMDIANGLAFSNKALFAEMMSMDLRALGPRLVAPFFIFQGVRRADAS